MSVIISCSILARSGMYKYSPPPCLLAYGRHVCGVRWVVGGFLALWGSCNYCTKGPPGDFQFRAACVSH
eukprot:11255455-Karenia_brevis.AAC.1